MLSISVVIPCHNHNNQLALPWILRSLYASKVSNLEVICVDDGCVTDIKAITDVYGARNRGHQISSGDITFYLDGDIIPEPRLLPEAIRLHKQTNRIAVKYPVYSILEADHGDALESLASLIISQYLARLGPSVRKHFGIDTRPLPRRLRGKKTSIWVLCASHCTSVEKREVERVGGWDETFFGWGEEDLELAYRLYRDGIKFVYPHRRHGAAYHLDHPVHWQHNLASLDRNLQYFRNKFPACWSGRQGLLRMFLKENNLPPIPAMTDEALPDAKPQERLPT